jgi:hypothetical protein
LSIARWDNINSGYTPDDGLLGVGSSPWGNVELLTLIRSFPCNRKGYKSPDRINARSHKLPDGFNARWINRPLNLRLHPRSKGFHGDVSAGGFALLQILGDDLGDWEVGKLESAIGLYVFSILQYADFQVAAVVAPQFGNS